MRVGLAVIACLPFLLGASCPPNPPDPPPTCVPTPAGEPTFFWRGDDQVDISWEGMPITVCEGEDPQAKILQLRAVLDLPSPRTPVFLDSFCGLDRGDVAEMEVSMYDDQNRALYRRSLHLEGGVPDCYDAYDPRPSLSSLPTSRVVMDAVCRANGPNEVTGSISARCHLQGTVTFEPVTDPPDPPDPPIPPTCNIPDAANPDWTGLGGSRTTRDELEAAKATVGDRTGEDPLETLALLAAAVRDAGGCAVGPWDDEVAIRRSDSTPGQIKVDGWHAVAFTTGGYTLNPKGDPWLYTGPIISCGPPLPPPAFEITIRHHGGTANAPRFDSTGLVKGFDYCTSVGFVNRGACPVRPECSGPGCEFRDREACEQLVFGTPVWTSNGEVIPVGNPWQRKVKNGSWVQVCTGPEIEETVCSRRLEY